MPNYYIANRATGDAVAVKESCIRDAQQTSLEKFGFEDAAVFDDMMVLICRHGKKGWVFSKPYTKEDS